MCQRLVSLHGGALGLDRATAQELKEARGIGDATVAQIKAALELGRRAVSANPESAARVRSPEDLWNLTRAEMVGLEREELRVVVLDTKNNVRGMHALYKGTLNTTTVRMAELFRDAIRSNAAAIALIHNHPSGDPTPSPQDVQLTRDAVEAGKHLDVEVVDHIVVGHAEPYYVSLRERGLGFSGKGR
jgi:DNA repair protein RadC